ncbi:PTS sugar transporter subunit IIA [Streptococcus devriesei]|uniref:PTS sugar transporter subunit IIA n=1 Tax=Streptococcus devriesei TaxID=231233 RepID=UPI000481CA7B|nr:PTS sugar transporter subunit IIA [Streptococcus devriesei]
MLSKQLKTAFIQLDIEVNNFEEAIRESMLPLKEDAAISQQYIDEVIKIYHETGPYIVLTRHVALPHAPGHLGAKKVAIGFTRLKHPVMSGNKDNDPVKFLFPLSAPDSHSHIALLSELADLLGDPDFLEEMAVVENSEEFITFLEEYEGGQNV